MKTWCTEKNRPEQLTRPLPRWLDGPVPPDASPVWSEDPSVFWRSQFRWSQGSRILRKLLLVLLPLLFRSIFFFQSWSPGMWGQKFYCQQKPEGYGAKGVGRGVSLPWWQPWTSIFQIPLIFSPSISSSWGKVFLWIIILVFLQWTLGRWLKNCHWTKELSFFISCAVPAKILALAMSSSCPFQPGLLASWSHMPLSCASTPHSVWSWLPSVLWDQVALYNSPFAGEQEISFYRKGWTVSNWWRPKCRSGG